MANLMTRQDRHAKTAFSACTVLAVALHTALVPLLASPDLRPGPPGAPRSTVGVQVRVVQRDIEAAVRSVVAAPVHPAVDRLSDVSKPVAQRVPQSLVALPAKAGLAGELVGEHGDDAYLPRSALTVPPAARSTVVVPYPVFDGDAGRYAARLSLYIDENGRVRRVHLDNEDLPEPLKLAIRDAFVSAEFLPGELNGRAVRSRMRIEVTFAGPAAHG
jgi:hypothetical protein